jgi:hypothetical protein
MMGGPTDIVPLLAALPRLAHERPRDVLPRETQTGDSGLFTADLNTPADWSCSVMTPRVVAGLCWIYAATISTE